MRPKDKPQAGAQLRCAAPTRPSINKHGRNNIGGFSLAELLISMTIGLLILFAVYQTFTVHNRHLKTQELKATTMQNARVGLDFIIRELRMAGYNPTGALTDCTGTNTAPAPPPYCVGITAAAADSISFTADLNGNGNLTPDATNPDENITYDIYSSEEIMYLGRTCNNSPRQPVAMNITGLSFIYYDGSDQTSANLALIRKIRVSVTAQAAAVGVNNVYQTITLSSDIVPKGRAY